MEKNNPKAQIWFTDFAIAILIFSLVLISYYTYTTNVSNQDSLEIEDLISDAKTVSSSLTTKGYPDNWNANTVARIGFTDNDNRIDNAKFNEFVKINYNETKKLFGTIYDYFLYFVNESGDVQNIEGFCGIGYNKVNITYDIKSAYYYEGDTANGEDFLKSFMEDQFNAVVYCESDPKCTSSLFFNDFISNMNNYDFIVVEHPTWSNDNFNTFEDAADPWVTGGGNLFVGGEIGSSQQSNGFNVQFKKISGTSESDKLATVVNEDEFVAFKEKDNIIFRQAFYIKVVGQGSVIDIARFNGTWVEFNDIKQKGDIALARWAYGSGKIFFFSDFDANYLSGNFQEILKGTARKWANAACLPIGIDNVKRENLVKAERILIHNSDIVKMMLYVWQ